VRLQPSADDAAIYGQGEYAIRFDWGLDGALAVGQGVDAVVVVDVLSFTTSVTVAVGMGIDVVPYRWRDESAVGFASEQAAVLAGNRGEGVSLSPASLTSLSSGTRLVLPSPNGATICAALAEAGRLVVAGSLRNAAAVAALVTEMGWSVAVVAAGEHWRGSSGMRPCLEDLLGAGAVLANLRSSSRSPEAAAAAAAFEAGRADLAGLIGGCAGGRELKAWGFADDVAQAVEYSVSEVVPVLSDDGAFRAAPAET
jgi:2-phosphosulfolactate phosphatase